MFDTGERIYDLDDFDRLIPVGIPPEAWLKQLCKRPPGFVSWSPYDLFGTWGMCPSRPMSDKAVDQCRTRLMRALGDSGEANGWDVIFLRDAFSGRQNLTSIVCRVHDSDGTVSKAAREVYAIERLYYRRAVKARMEHA